MDLWVDVFEWGLAALCIGILLYLATRKVPSRNRDWMDGGNADIYGELADSVKDRGRAYREGGYHGYGLRDADNSDERYDNPHGYPRDGRVTFGKRHTRPAPLALSARQIEHVNIQRKLGGKRPLNLHGVRRAINVAPPPRVGVMTGDQWFAYLIAYEAMTETEHGSTLRVDSGITVTPGGGEFGGAGASGSWDNPPAGGPTGGITIMAPDNIEPSLTGNGYHYANTDPETVAPSTDSPAQRAAEPDPISAPSAPDSAPAASPDTSSCSVDSPATSCDTGS